MLSCKTYYRRRNQTTPTRKKALYRREITMAKSFCNGCKYWEWCSPGYGEPGFHYCAKLNTDSLLERKERCGGKLREDK